MGLQPQLGVLLLIVPLLFSQPPTVLAASPPSSVVMLLTDDQDANLGSMDAMTKTTALLGDGTTFSNMFVTTPICCPSRSSFLTGTYAHSTRTFQNQMNCGCSNHSVSQTSALWYTVSHSGTVALAVHCSLALLLSTNGRSFQYRKKCT